MKNWKTTFVGVIGAVVTVLVERYTTGTVDAKTLVMAATLAALGFLAKDLNVTGGTVKQ